MSPATPMGASHVVIVGSMAVGKSTVGRRLAESSQLRGLLSAMAGRHRG